ncbi:putative phage tail protein [Clostridium sp. CF012]|uniref:putative phage tail protein n=1 Tax=Clostridium sp. CF012 TaxID=2843319 RepID=UPI001C0DB562|nr:putative phage tail protein [Clostridium sp. CF012]MBU3146892.1 YmfQ family protein [Clostridium sp. CF012]
MLYNESLINNLHKDYRQDPWIVEIYNSAGITLDTLELTTTDLENQYSFDTMTWAIPILEKRLKIKTNPLSSIEDRRSFVEAKWKSSGKCTLDFIQAICNSWKNGEIAVDFVGGRIQIKFVGATGIPTDLNGLKDAIEEAKPCHLLVDYLFKYLLIKDIHNTMTINQLQTTKINQFAGRG